jgi:REP element-mobilizing transposase RayT
MGDSLSVIAITLVCDRRGASHYPEHALIWQKHFYDFNVRTEQKQIEKLRYIHRNPVKRGLVDCPEQWECSSFRS